MPDGCREVVITKAGQYNDWQGNKKDLEPGDRLVTRVWYARELVEDGFARWPEAWVAPADDDMLEIEMAEMAAEEMEAEMVLAMPANVMQAMRERGLTTLAAVRQASDEELLSVPGIGLTRLREIREAMGD